MLFTTFTAADEFADAHIASLDQACETPGGYSREFLTAVRQIARNRLAAMPLLPVSTDGPGYLVQHRIGKRIEETHRLKQVIRECAILLEGIPCEFEEAADELAQWLDEDRSLELAADLVVMGRAA